MDANKARELFSYDPETGTLRWRSYVYKSSIAPGDEAGSIGGTGYRKVTYRRKTYPVHRIMWLMVYGYWPTEIDHINRCRSDNRLRNLRDVSHSDNLYNSPIYRNNRSGFKGVFWNAKNGNWIATLGRKPNYLGSFPCIGKAIAARHAAEKERGLR